MTRKTGEAKNRPIIESGGVVREIYPNGKMSRRLTTDEIEKRIEEERESGNPVTFSFGHTERIIRRMICNGP